MKAASDAIDAPVKLSPQRPVRLSDSISSTSLQDSQLLQVYVSHVKPQHHITTWWLKVLCNSPDQSTVNLAVRALIYGHGAVACGGPLVTRSRHAYGNSVHSLRKAVARPQNADRLALQNAILVLSMYEFYSACMTRGAKTLTLQELEGCVAEQRTWVYHAKAIEHIMRLQGPEIYSDDADRFVYISMRDALVSPC